MTPRASIVGTLVFMLFGPLVWGVQMAASYAAHASLCAAATRLPFRVDSLPWLLPGFGVVAAAATIIALLRPERLGRWLGAPRNSEEASFVRGVMRLLALLSLFGIAYSLLNVGLLPLCEQLR